MTLASRGSKKKKNGPLFMRSLARCATDIAHTLTVDLLTNQYIASSGSKRQYNYPLRPDAFSN